MLNNDACRGAVELDNIPNVEEGDEEDDITSEKESAGNAKKNKAETRSRDNKISKELRYNIWMRNNIRAAGEERLVIGDVKKEQLDRQEMLELEKKNTSKKCNRGVDVGIERSCQFGRGSYC